MAFFFVQHAHYTGQPSSEKIFDFFLLFLTSSFLVFQSIRLLAPIGFALFDRIDVAFRHVMGRI